VASDSAARPPTAASGTTVRAETRLNADPPRDGARRADDTALRAGVRMRTDIPSIDDARYPWPR